MKPNLHSSIPRSYKLVLLLRLQLYEGSQTAHSLALVNGSADCPVSYYYLRLPLILLWSMVSLFIFFIVRICVLFFCFYSFLFCFYSFYSLIFCFIHLFVFLFLFYISFKHVLIYVLSYLVSLLWIRFVNCTKYTYFFTVYERVKHQYPQFISYILLFFQ